MTENCNSRKVQNKLSEDAPDTGVGMVTEAAIVVGSYSNVYRFTLGISVRVNPITDPDQVPVMTAQYSSNDTHSPYDMLNRQRKHCIDGEAKEARERSKEKTNDTRPGLM